MSMRYRPADIATIVCCTDAKEDYYRTTAEGLLFRMLGPLIHQSAEQSPLLQQLLTAPGLPKPETPNSSHDIPIPNPLAAPVGQPVEKDRVRLQVSLCKPCTCCLHYGCSCCCLCKM